MTDDNKQKVVNLLMDLYKSNGFVTEDEVFEQSSNEQLSFLEINYVTDYLLSHGVIIGVSKDKIIEQKGRGYRHDYSNLFKKIGKEYKGLRPLLKYYESIDPLAEKEWIMLLQQSRRGNTWARNRLFDTSMQKAIRQAYIASQKFDVDFEDVLQSVTFGIFNAIDTFDETEHSSFPSYVALAINSRIQHAVYLSSNPLISFPPYLKDNIFKIYTTVKNHICSECCYKKNKLFCTNLNKQLQEKLECNEDEVIERVKYLQPIEGIKDNSVVCNEDPISNVRVQEIKNTVSSALIDLKPREECVIRMRFGIGIINECTLEEIGQKYDLTRERIRQIEKSAFGKLSRNTRIKRIAKELINN